MIRGRRLLVSTAVLLASTRVEAGYNLTYDGDFMFGSTWRPSALLFTVQSDTGMITEHLILDRCARRCDNDVRCSGLFIFQRQGQLLPTCFGLSVIDGQERCLSQWQRCQSYTKVSGTSGRPTATTTSATTTTTATSLTSTTPTSTTTTTERTCGYSAAGTGFVPSDVRVWPAGPMQYVVPYGVADPSFFFRIASAMGENGTLAAAMERCTAACSAFNELHICGGFRLDYPALAAQQYPNAASQYICTGVPPGASMIVTSAYSFSVVNRCPPSPNCHGSIDPVECRNYSISQCTTMPIAGTCPVLCQNCPPTAAPTSSPTPPPATCRGSCGRARGFQTPGGLCFCEAGCLSYGDCCGDFIDECTTTPPSHSPTTEAPTSLAPSTAPSDPTAAPAPSPTVPPSTMTPTVAPMTAAPTSMSPSSAPTTVAPTSMAPNSASPTTIAPTSSTTSTTTGTRGRCAGSLDPTVCALWLTTLTCSSDVLGRTVSELCPVACDACVTTTTTMPMPSCSGYPDSQDCTLLAANCGRVLGTINVTASCPATCSACPDPGPDGTFFRYDLIHSGFSSDPSSRDRFATITDSSLWVFHLPDSSQASVTLNECQARCNAVSQCAGVYLWQELPSAPQQCIGLASLGSHDHPGECGSFICLSYSRAYFGPPTVTASPTQTFTTPSPTSSTPSAAPTTETPTTVPPTYAPTGTCPGGEVDHSDCHVLGLDCDSFNGVTRQICPLRCDACPTPAPTTAPTTLAPTTLAPTTLAPTTSMPTTLIPTTSAPTTFTLITSAPVSNSPTIATFASTTAAPTTATPTTVAPVTLAPVTGAPVTANPTTASPTFTPTSTSPSAAPTRYIPPAPPTTVSPTSAAPSLDALGRCNGEVDYYLCVSLAGQCREMNVRLLCPATCNACFAPTTAPSHRPTDSPTSQSPTTVSPTRQPSMAPSPPPPPPPTPICNGWPDPPICQRVAQVCLTPAALYCPGTCARCTTAPSPASLSPTTSAPTTLPPTNLPSFSTQPLVTTTPAPITNCTGCAFGSGPCKFVQNNVCVELSDSTGVCPVGSLRCDSIDTSVGDFCVGRRIDQSQNIFFFRQERSCSTAPYYYPAVLSFKAAIVAQQGTVQWCLRVSTASVPVAGELIASPGQPCTTFPIVAGTMMVAIYLPMQVIPGVTMTTCILSQGGTISNILTGSSCATGSQIINLLSPCDVGYVTFGNNGACANIDECTDGLSDCDMNARCTDTPGSFTCTCNAGWFGRSGTVCTDVADCSDPQLNNCSVHATCNDGGGSYTCSCNSGWSGDGIECENIDECQVNTDACAVGTGTCTDTPGSFTCTCTRGWIGSGLQCTDIDECSIGTDNCHRYAECANTPGSFSCTCRVGFSGDGVVCGDVDECMDSSTNGCDARAICEDERGYYSCTCRDGYSGNGFQCANVDECLAEIDSCHSLAYCTDTDGSFTCTCRNGFTGSGTFCGNVDECLDELHNCDVNAECTDSFGTFACECNEGWSGDGHICNDIDECSLASDDCHMEASCINTAGSFTCGCNVGWTGSGLQCMSVNECSQSPPPCDLQATCIELAGSFVCDCNSGWSGTGVTCTNVDECSMAPCGPFADCADTLGSFTCSCGTGRVLSSNGSYCLNVNECADGVDNCSPFGSVCTDTPGSFDCTCDTGYLGDGVQCTDLDECVVNTTICGSDAYCRNVPGSFECSCNPGYTGNGHTCTDINECAANLCHANATCTNTIGSFTCTCNSGYFEIGPNVCGNIDECARQSHNCHINAECTDSQGSFSCTCETGFTSVGTALGDGSECLDINECALTSRNQCDGNAECTNLLGSYQCSCNAGWMGQGHTADGLLCDNEYECDARPCHQNAICDDLPGSFLCTCGSGYSGDGRWCRDIDECAENLHVCPRQDHCVNLNGTYTCRCPRGMIWSTLLAQPTCVNQNECIELQPCDANADCVDTVGSYTCSCRPGFIGDGIACIASTTTTDSTTTRTDSTTTATSTTSTLTTTTVANCTSDLQMRCMTSQQCVPLAYRCNGFLDCADGSDEFNCPTPPPTVAPTTQVPSTSPTSEPSSSPTEGPTQFPTAVPTAPTSAPTTATPSTPEPTTVAPTTSEPTLAPSTMTPTTQAPSTLSPTETSPPVTFAPTTLAPTSANLAGQPTTLSPTTLAPITSAPRTFAPTTFAPTTISPTTSQPTTLAPTTLPTLSPTSESPTSLAPTTVINLTTTVAPTIMSPSEQLQTVPPATDQSFTPTNLLTESPTLVLAAADASYVGDDREGSGADMLVILVAAAAAIVTIGFVVYFRKFCPDRHRSHHLDKSTRDTDEEYGGEVIETSFPEVHQMSLNNAFVPVVGIHDGALAQPETKKRLITYGPADTHISPLDNALLNRWVHDELISRKQDLVRLIEVGNPKPGDFGVIKNAPGHDLWGVLVVADESLKSRRTEIAKTGETQFLLKASRFTGDSDLYIEAATMGELLEVLSEGGSKANEVHPALKSGVDILSKAKLTVAEARAAELENCNRIPGCDGAAVLFQRIQSGGAITLADNRAHARLIFQKCWIDHDIAHKLLSANDAHGAFVIWQKAHHRSHLVLSVRKGLSEFDVRHFDIRLLQDFVVLHLGPASRGGQDEQLKCRSIEELIVALASPEVPAQLPCRLTVGLLNSTRIDEPLLNAVALERLDWMRLVPEALTYQVINDMTGELQTLA